MGVNLVRKLSKINKLALKYFRGQLQQNLRAKKYLKCERGIPVKIIDKYKLGFIHGVDLFAFLRKHNFTKKDLIQAGFAFRDVNTGSLRPVFKNRIIIPIFSFGKVVAFGGRDLSGRSKSKYINSKSTVLYDKSNTLFNLHRSYKHIHKKGLAILLEGYFDCMSLAAQGIRNTVATCGTALTDQHVLLIRRYADEICILYDGDAAGQVAASKTEKFLDNMGIPNFNVKLPDQLDPDDFIRKFNKSKLLRRIERARP